MKEMQSKRGLKAKTIKTILRKKINKWLMSIKNEELRNLCRNEAIVTGGAIASMLSGEDVNDFDVYFRTKETVKAVADYYVSEFLKSKEKQGGGPVHCYVEELTDISGKYRVRIVVQSDGTASLDHDAGQYVDEAFDVLDANNLIGCDDELDLNVDDYSPQFISSNAISLRGKVQLILRFYGHPEEIHQNYDFAHCMNFWESGESKLTLKQDALECLLSRTLVYHGSQYPLCSVIRSRKFIERGWRINAGQYLKMAMQLSELDLSDHLVLEEQLTGVDVAYFSEVIQKIKAKDPNKVDATYLVQIINRMF